MRFAARHARFLPAVPALLYAALPTRAYYWDGITFAILAESRAPLRQTLHPSHLLYAAAGTWLYRAATALGFEIRALYLLQAVNIVLAAAAVLLVYRSLARFMGSEQAIAGALAFAFAATWWKFATDVNAYVPSIFLILCANDLMEQRRFTVGAALAHAGAMLFHELAILFLPVVWLRLNDRKRAAVYTGIALAPVTLAYVLAYREVAGSFHAAGFLRWIVSASPDAGFSFSPLRNLSWTVTGTLRLFFGGRLGWVTVPAAVLAAIALLAALGVAVRTLRRFGRPTISAPPRDLLVWAALTAAFLFFWMPRNTFYRLFYLAPLLMLLWRCIKSPAPGPALPAVCCAVLFCWNLAFLIYPQSLARNNPPLRFALAQHGHWPAGTPVVFHSFHPDLWTISYFNPQVSWIGLDQLDLERLEQGLAWARERRQTLWLEATAYDFLAAAPAGREWLAAHRVTSVLIDRDTRHEYRFHALEP